MWPVRDRTSTARPADPLWDPELILADHPVWIGHAARPPNPDWEPELIIRDEEFPDRGESREQEKTSAAVDSAFPDRAHSRLDRPGRCASRGARSWFWGS